jgi:hypothetical protein
MGADEVFIFESCSTDNFLGYKPAKKLEEREIA